MDDIRIETFGPGDLGEIVAWHGRYYAEHWGFDHTFEADVARRLGTFALAFDPARDGLWTAGQGKRFAGGVAVNASTAEHGGEHGGEPGEGVMLRWFIVPPAFQGQGLGGRLLDTAMDFCVARGHGRVFLWTFEGLDAARVLYERAGFRQTAEEPRVLGGRQVRMQRLEWRGADPA